MNRDEMVKFLKFSIVGVSNTLISLVSFYIIFEYVGLSYIVASILGYIIGLTNSYFWNLRWTFRHTHSFNVLIKFIVVNIIALSLKLLIITFLVENIGLYELYSEVIAMGFAIVINFLGNRFWTFKKI